VDKVARVAGWFINREGGGAWWTLSMELGFWPMVAGWAGGVACGVHYFACDWRKREVGVAAMHEERHVQVFILHGIFFFQKLEDKRR